MSKQYNVHAAKTNLSQLLTEVQQGEEVIIAKGGVPIARLVPIERTNNVKFGFLKGIVSDISDEDWQLADAEFRASFRDDKWV